jgi:hypothetical protein
MPNFDHNCEEYRTILLGSQADRIFAYRDGRSWRVPKISVPVHTRPAEHLQNAFRRGYGVNIVVLDRWYEHSSACALTEQSSLRSPASLTQVPLEEIADCDFRECERERLRAILRGERGPLSRPGWMEEAIAWTNSEVYDATVCADGIRQYNAGGGFTLLRIPFSDGRSYWLKATGVPNLHERATTILLAQISRDAVPGVVASRKDWNAWLMEDAGEPIDDQMRLPGLRSASAALAALQKACATRHTQLLAAGASDSSLERLGNGAPLLIEYLSKAMERQISKHVAPLPSGRLRHTRKMLEEACAALAALEIPETVVHNDINPGNILYDGSRSVITDCAEVGVSNPFLAFEYLLLLTPSEPERRKLRDIYAASWLDCLSRRQIEQAFRLAPLVAAASYLYGRGDWLTSSFRGDRVFDSCARSVGRHMDHIAHSEDVREALCK